MKFSEVQRAPRGLVYGIMVFAVLFATLSVMQAPQSSQFLAMVITIIPLVLIASGLVTISLNVNIDDKNIDIKTLFWVKRTIALKDIAKAEAYNYRPLRDFGGYGVRYAKGGVMYNMAGGEAVKLTLKNGDIIYIGTKKTSELLQAIHKKN